MILCGGQGVRELRKSCAFCVNRAVVQGDGDRCIRRLCGDHRWSAAEDLDFFPPCEHNFLLAAATPKQTNLFGKTMSRLRRRYFLRHWKPGSGYIITFEWGAAYTPL